MYFVLFIILSFHEMGGAILHLCIIESTYQVSYFYLTTKSEPGSKKGVSLGENEAMENTQRVTLLSIKFHTLQPGQRSQYSD